jgi:tetratricopeptide (TPR) repeat protein
MIKGQPAADSPPFDLLTDRYQPYKLAEPEKTKDELVKVITAALSSIRETDSPIFKMLPTLRETEPASVAQVVPQDLIEEVDRAKAAKSKGWLRLLATEVAGRRFQWPAQRLIGQAQWDLEDWEGARKTFERVRENDPYDIPANLALANVYERTYRRDPLQEDMLRRSDQAIERVLSRSDRTTELQRAEALGLKGRNRKTEWRLGFAKIDDLAARRKNATNLALREAYEEYRVAYLSDLNHFWPGLAALQLGTIALDLSSDEEAWADTFETTEAAQAYARELERAVKELRAAVPLAVKAALTQLPGNHKDRLWAEMSPADVSFVIEERETRVIRAYKDAVPKSNRFAWNAAKGQLALFASLGIRAKLVDEIIRQVEDILGTQKADVEPHIVIFTGHQIDEAGRGEPRFPADREGRARELIHAKLEQLKGEPVGVLASAAPGSDIICHEICRELGIKSTICLPMPPDKYASEVFGDLDTWRSRYLELTRHLPLLQLSDRSGLPNWLSGNPPIDPWERGNQWVLEMAITGGAKVTFLVLWDGKDFSGNPGGTGHMVAIARQFGTVHIDRVDAQLLLAD